LIFPPEKAAIKLDAKHTAWIEKLAWLGPEMSNPNGDCNL
jgi:hypothetical protein